MHSRIDQMLGKFYQFADVDQVEVGELNRNPFRHELYLSNLDGLLDDKQKGMDDLTGGNLQLWSIIQTKFVELASGSGAHVILKMPE
jgi:hypothetical protein